MPKIPVGLATIFGLALAAVEAGCALVLYLSGDHTTARELIGSTTVTSAVVKAGRYLQSNTGIVVKDIADGLAPVAEDLGKIEIPTATEAELGKNAAAVAVSPDAVDNSTVSFASGD